MTRILQVFLCTAVIVLMITAGCTFGKNTGPGPLVTGTTAAPETQPVTTTVTATQPAAAGTTSSGTCPADVSSDAANCGGCGLACPANAVCQQGQCYCAQGYTASGSQCVAAPAGTPAGNGCPSGMSPCPDGYCYELTSDAGHCGSCTNTCPTGMSCSASTCTGAPPVTTTVPVTTTSTVSQAPSKFATLKPSMYCVALGLTSCNNVCVNTTTDSENCGSCGTKCTGPLMGCCNGACTSYASDASNCGSCGHKCALNAVCKSGSCVAKTVVTGVTLLKPSLVITQIQYKPNYNIPLNP